MKRFLIAALALAMIAGVMAGCSPGTDPQNTTAGGATSDFDANKEITVVSRETGSGTRGAFVELMGIEKKNDAGEKVDRTYEEAIETKSTGVMMTTVAGDKYAIGYISLGSLNDTVKAVDIDGVAATAENVKNGTYKVSRPFNIVKKKGADSELANDFIGFILSDEGQAVITGNGYISEGGTGAYAGSKPSGRITVAGSTSVGPVMVKLKEAYLEINTSAKIDIQESDSSNGMKSAIDGIADIGMASRSLKDTELDAGLEPIVIALDGIAVIVNKSNPVENLVSAQIEKIFTEGTRWSEFSAD